MSNLKEIGETLDKMVKEISEYLKQKDLAEFKSNPAFASELVVGMFIITEKETSLDFINDISEIVDKYGYEVTGVNIYPLNGVSAIYIHIALE